MSAIIYYHANCPDGLTAAAVTRQYCRKHLGMPTRNVICLPIHYGTPPEIPEALPSALQHIYFVDFCPDADQLDVALETLGHEVPITIVDHHITQQDVGRQLEGDYPNLTFIFDNNESGASLCAKHLLCLSEGSLPYVVRDVRDIDLWHWERSTSYGITTLIGQKNDIGVVDRLLDAEGYFGLLPTAEALSEFHQGMAQKQAQAAMLAHVQVKRDGALLWESQGMIPVLATDGMTSSLAVNRAIDRYQTDMETDIGIGFYTSMDQDSLKAFIKLSARGNGEHSTLEVTQPLGGGGHRNASGARASRIEILADENRVVIHA